MKTPVPTNHRVFHVFQPLRPSPCATKATVQQKDAEPRVFDPPGTFGDSASATIYAGFGEPLEVHQVLLF